MVFIGLTPAPQEPTLPSWQAAPAKPLLDDADPPAGPCVRAWNFTKLLIQVSRPGFYNVTGFLYVISVATDPELLLSCRAVAGLLFCLFPLNLLVYSMNDLADVDIDAKNPRKGGLFGAVASEEDLRRCVAISAVLCAVLPFVITRDLVWSLAFSTVGIGANWLYNFGPRLSRVPLLDMLPPLAYLLVVPFGAKVMGRLDSLSPYIWVVMVFVVLRTQLWFQRFDLEADASVGKTTTATFIGWRLSALGVLLFMAFELFFEWKWGCLALQMWSAFSACVFLLELGLQNKGVTKALMAISGAVFLVPVLQCF